VSPEQHRARRPRRPASLSPAAADALVGGPDPAQRVEAAHAFAEALVRRGRSADDEVTARLVGLADEHGIDQVAELWADRPGDSLPGALWRLYALRAGIRLDPVGLARAFDAGRHHAPVHEVVAGVGEPPGPAEVQALADAVLAGAFTGDLGVALERAGAFCRVVSTGWAVLADDLDPEIGGHPASHPFADLDRPGRQLTVELSAAELGPVTRRAADLLRTATQLESAAARWRAGSLH
jgi:hypothetical protein